MKSVAQIKYWAKRLLPGLFLVLVVIGIYQTYKPLPAGLSMHGQSHGVPEQAVSFLADYSFVDSAGEFRTRQEIFDQLFSLVAEAERFVLLDMFLFNDFWVPETVEHRNLSGELTDLLLQKRQENPEIEIIFISDPINKVYSANPPEQFVRLKEAGVRVVFTDLKKLRDSNLIYSPFWRLFFQWGGRSSGGFLPNFFNQGEAGVSLRSYLKMLNFKANHRKVLVADSLVGEDRTLSTIVTSANPHDGSSWHENVAIRVDGFIWPDILRSEQAVLDLSGSGIQLPLAELEEFSTFEESAAGKGKLAAVKVLTEGKIQENILELINRAVSGDSVKIVMFYLSERKVINDLLEASKRGVDIRLVLDPNKDAFGQEKIGIPNRPVARELHEKSRGDIKIRWCDTRGEQCHSKMTLIESAGEKFLSLGSANLTRRNLGDYNLETNLLVSGSDRLEVVEAAEKYFLEIWENRGDKNFTTRYQKYHSDSRFKSLAYQLLERSGFSSF